MLVATSRIGTIADKKPGRQAHAYVITLIPIDMTVSVRLVGLHLKMLITWHQSVSFSHFEKDYGFSALHTSA
jgi:hypothetical protein